MKVAIHQPDLLPWPGFWFKMVNCDLFVLAVHDQLQKHWVQRRVMMRETWVTLPLETKPHLIPIKETMVKPGWQDHLEASITGRYRNARHWKDRSGDVLAMIHSVDSHNLAEVNHQMILSMRDYLGITTDVVVTDPPQEKAADRVLEQLQMVGATSYLSGTGAKDYLGDEARARFADLGIGLEFSDHHKTTGDSIVTVLMDHDDPMEIVAKAAAGHA
ncbi:WbqC family protein [Nocardioides zhouii]|uniref:WbqC family protein n=1 Tax=Nocardioides zhouii TaxID=1168729 RepID=A0A4Q2SJQ7_9ACTN|nr:WbqC family protein [Nocardioides zhouii]RYC05826.1 hypothetical protein EUA94_17330 [Nocardioides zhouii]